MAFAATHCVAGPLPLTVKDVSLMLRTGYSSESILRELETRRFADTLDEMKQKSLVHSGAPPALIEALASGRFAVSATEAGRVKQQLEDESKRQAALAAESRKKDFLYQSQLTRERSSPGRMPESFGPVREALKGDLVHSVNGDLVRYDDDLLSKKRVFALYFAAHWCPSCRQFTPQLVEYYKQASATHPELEVILISGDHSLEEMQRYMRDANMNWPAVAFDRIGGKESLRKYAGKGIPDLVIVDGTGKVLSDSYVNGEYVGPARVLAELDAMFAKSAPRVVAHL